MYGQWEGYRRARNIDTPRFVETRRIEWVDAPTLRRFVYQHFVIAVPEGYILYRYREREKPWIVWVLVENGQLTKVFRIFTSHISGDGGEEVPIDRAPIDEIKRSGTKMKAEELGALDE